MFDMFTEWLYWSTNLTRKSLRQTAQVVDAVQIPRIGPSLGGVESLIEQPMVMSYWNYSATERATFGIPENMIRMACGIEDAADLIADLDQALATIAPLNRPSAG